MFDYNAELQQARNLIGVNNYHITGYEKIISVIYSESNKYLNEAFLKMNNPLTFDKYCSLLNDKIKNWKHLEIESIIDSMVTSEKIAKGKYKDCYLTLLNWMKYGRVGKPSSK